jgi:hypothetical protein
MDPEDQFYGGCYTSLSDSTFVFLWFQLYLVLAIVTYLSTMIFYFNRWHSLFRMIFPCPFVETISDECVRLWNGTDRTSGAFCLESTQGGGNAQNNSRCLFLCTIVRTPQNWFIGLYNTARHRSSFVQFHKMLSVCNPTFKILLLLPSSTH